ncbi:Hint domain-containing protein [Gluconobacter sphaericus]|uniref:Hint domain-containing protein n=1 Tax=Gluconobacter sphaericus TaxID=574987 RepID=UPI001F32B756|nr:Hint domain-containing protein [Gluconobacter sphaericus]
MTFAKGYSKDNYSFSGDTVTIVCFLPGSMIRTSKGEVAVEDLQIGDNVIALDWAANKDVSRSVVWAGKAHAVVSAHLPDDEAGWPVRILKNAIADGVPYKDMLITAEHCLFLDGKFVPARMLVNGSSIFYDKSITSYDYYHVETEQHSVITADGMLTESYLDTGNRRSFRQDGKVVSLTPSRALSWNDDAAAPLGVSREFVEPLFSQIEARAKQAAIASQNSAPVLTQESDLRLETSNGMVIHAARAADDRVVFMIPTGVKSVRIVSNASRPSDVIGPFVDDRRYFGVEVGEVLMFESNCTHNITAHLTEGELDGWNTLEQAGTRWTAGNAMLPLGERHPNSIALLALQIKNAGPYVLNETAKAEIAVTA